MSPHPDPPPHVVVPKPGYRYGGASECRSCGALMYWWRTLAGASSPHDVDGTSHFATCPNAQDHRRKRVD